LSERTIVTLGRNVLITKLEYNSTNLPARPHDRQTRQQDNQT
jgi:hypothetical protein